MNAMIFAAGRGTRLGELSLTTPKALMEVGGKSMLERTVEFIASYGFNRVIVNIHHLPDKMEDEIAALRLKGHAIAVSSEKDLLLDTGGGLFKAKDFFGDEPFLLFNVDILTDIDLHGMFQSHKKSGALATLALRNREGSRFFLVDAGGRLAGRKNRATGEEIIPGEAKAGLREAGFSGIHIVNPEIFDLMHNGVYSLTRLYLELCSRHFIGSYFHDEGLWLDVGTPEKLEEARKMFL